jgi:hypothetical protein
MDWGGGGGRGLGCGTFREGEEELVMVAGALAGVGSLLLLRKREGGIDELWKGARDGEEGQVHNSQVPFFLSSSVGCFLFFFFFSLPFSCCLTQTLTFYYYAELDLL